MPSRTTLASTAAALAAGIASTIMLVQAITGDISRAELLTYVYVLSFAGTLYFGIVSPHADTRNARIATYLFAATGVTFLGLNGRAIFPGSQGYQVERIAAAIAGMVLLTMWYFVASEIGDISQFVDEFWH